MLLYLVYPIALVFGTTLIHAGCTVMAVEWVSSDSRRWFHKNSLTRATAVTAVVLMMSLAACVESMLWAGLYVWVDALPDLGTALYFSLVTFTTLGYGDVTLVRGWRVLGAFEAANGVIMFGWTTALIVSVVQRMYFRDSPDA